MGDEAKPKRRIRRWTADDVIREIQALTELSAKQNQKQRPSLYSAANRYFGGWKSAVEAAGFNYHEVTKRKLQGYWSRERIIAEIKKTNEKSSSYIRKHNGDLYNAALRTFGSWKQAVEAAGFCYNSVRKGWVAIEGSQFRFQKRK